MDKNAIKKYAVWARNELIARVTQKAEQYEITEKKMTPKDADSINGRVLTDAEKNQRKALIEKIQADGFEQVMEEVAYTWFNRFTALRFMEVNNYLPSHTRVFTNETGEFKPQILADAIHLDLEGLDMGKVFELKEANKTEELYKYLLITQCNALSSILPLMFQKIEDYTELLLPDYLLREGSVVDQMISMIPENNFNVNTESGQIEIVGWMYQYYNDERKEEVIDMAGKTAIKKEDIPAATQLFTTDWIVRYIVDNSLGRYWIERHPESGLKQSLKYYASKDDVNSKTVKSNTSPEEITFFDPCIGSGHFALYAFTVLMEIYSECGYSEKEAVESIIKNNLFGMDIDNRASQLAYFSIMMKAREYDRRFFTRNIQPNILPIAESGNIHEDDVRLFANGDEILLREIKGIVEELKDGKEFGSLLHVDKHDYERLFGRLHELRSEIGLFNTIIADLFEPLIRTAQMLSKHYSIVATNPPYLNKYNAKLKDYLADNYKDYSGDLFSVFMYRNFMFCDKDGYTGFMTPFVWMFIKTYEKLRNYIVKEKNIVSLIQFEYSAYEEATVPICAFVMNNRSSNEKGIYIRLSDFKGGMAVQEKKYLEALSDEECRYLYLTSKEDFLKIPGMPIAYWLSDGLLDTFISSKSLSYYGVPKVGLQTGDTNRFLRYWYEPSFERISISTDGKQNTHKWFPICKGGDYRRWYGNNDYVVNWENDGYEIRNFKDDRGRLKSRPQNVDFYFKKGITWNLISSSSFAVRCYPEGMIFDVSANAFFCSDDLYYYIAGVLNSKIIFVLSQILNPTINFSAGVIANLPIKVDQSRISVVDAIVVDAIKSEKEDWDSFENSWNFQSHPLIPAAYKCQKRLQAGTDSEAQVILLSECYRLWEQECECRFTKVKKNEEELNRIFIDIYGLHDELTPEVVDKDVTVRKANLQRDIRGLMSYAIGCMFGRYSLDVPGLVYAGGTWDESKYTTFLPDKDAIIPICDDEYFEDDIVCRFVKFIEVVYGKETMEENLKFIADALGGKGTSREVIRNYFMNEFYADHVKIYQKRPIYWLFDSGKKNGFKCLVYIHRYQPDTTARIRTDYVHEQQSRYRTAIADLENRVNNAGTSERVKLNKQLSSLQAQATEIREYEEKIHHLADQMISIDLDDGVKHNYEIFKDVLAKIK